MRRHDTPLANPLTEEISALKFLPASNDHGGEERYLAVASWDGSVRIYDFKKNVVLVICDTGEPVLALCAVGPLTVAFGGLERNLYTTEINQSGASTGKATLVGSHDEGICAVEYCDTHHFIVTGSWDSTIRLWSPEPGKENRWIGTISTDNKMVFCLNIRGNLCVAGLEDGCIGVWDLRRYNSPLRLLDVKDSLNIQCIAILPDMKRIVYGTVEGRASVESIDEKLSKNDFLFKPHVDKVKGVNHPVNAVCCTEGSTRFLMGGSDGKVRLWDPDTRKLIADFPTYPNEIAALAISPSGTHSAVACCRLDDRDVKKEKYKIPPPALYIRNISQYMKTKSQNE